VASLVTGGTGFLGCELAKMLVQRGERVVLFDVAPSYAAVESIKNKVSIMRGDLGNWSEVFNAVKDHEVKSIFHLGGMLSLPSEANPWAAYRVNANGTMHILEAARLFGSEKVIFASTLGVYGPRKRTIINESAVEKPETMYGSTKLFAEHLGRFYAKKFGLDFRAVRFPTLVGPGATTKHPSQYMPWMIEYSLAKKPFDVWVEENCRVPFIYHKDAANALLMLHDAPRENIKTLVYNLAGTSLTAREFADKVVEHIPSAQIRFRPDPEIVKMLGGGFDVIDDSCAQKEWGWKMSFDMEDMMQDFERTYRASAKSRR